MILYIHTVRARIASMALQSIAAPRQWQRGPRVRATTPLHCRMRRNAVVDGFKRVTPAMSIPPAIRAADSTKSTSRQQNAHVETDFFSGGDVRSEIPAAPPRNRHFTR
jgi:hypothetical protein